MPTIIDPKDSRVHAIFVRLHCRAMAKGMTHSKLSKTKVLKMAGEVTGQTYKRGEHDKAAEDITKQLETANG